jgi:hypothetical protein
MIEHNILQQLAYRSPLLARQPSDMFYYTNYYNNVHDKTTLEIPKDGFYKFADIYEEKRTGNTVYDFLYYINDIGYREKYPSPDTTNVIGFFGCSFTFGMGVPTEHTFYYQLANNCPYINFGDPSASINKIALMFNAAANIWNMSTAIITLPSWTRFNYTDKMNNFVPIVASDPPFSVEETEQVKQSLFKYFSNQFFYSELKNALTLIVTTAKLHNIKLMLGSWDLETVELTKLVTGLECIYWKISDVGRDKSHPGPKSHFEYFKKLKE